MPQVDSGNYQGGQIGKTRRVRDSLTSAKGERKETK